MRYQLLLFGLLATLLSVQTASSSMLERNRPASQRRLHSRTVSEQRGVRGEHSQGTRDYTFPYPLFVRIGIAKRVYLDKVIEEHWRSNYPLVAHGDLASRSGYLHSEIINDAWHSLEPRLPPHLAAIQALVDQGRSFRPEVRQHWRSILNLLHEAILRALHQPHPRFHALDAYVQAQIWDLPYALPTRLPVNAFFHGRHAAEARVLAALRELLWAPAPERAGLPRPRAPPRFRAAVARLADRIEADPAAAIRALRHGPWAPAPHGPLPQPAAAEYALGAHPRRCAEVGFDARVASAKAARRALPSPRVPVPSIILQSDRPRG